MRLNFAIRYVCTWFLCLRVFFCLHGFAVDLWSCLCNLMVLHSTTVAARTSFRCKFCMNFVLVLPANCKFPCRSFCNPLKSFASCPQKRLPRAIPARACWRLAQTPPSSLLLFGMYAHYPLHLLSPHSRQVLLSSAASSSHPNVCFAILESMCNTVRVLKLSLSCSIMSTFCQV